MPLYYFLNIGGLHPFDKNSSHFNFQKFKLFYGIILLITCLVAEIVIDDTLFDKFHTNSSIIKFILKSSSPFMMLSLISNHLTIFLSRKKLEDVVEEFIFSDSQLWIISSLEGVERNMKPLIRWSIALAVIYLNNTFRFLSFKVVLMKRASFLPSIKVFGENNQILVSVCFILVLVLMEERFSTINKLVNLKIQESNHQEKYPFLCDGLNKFVNEIVSIHRRNSKLMEKINGIFSFVLLVNLIAVFLNLLGAIHLILCKFAFPNLQNNLLETIELIAYSISIACVPLIMAQKSMNLCEQAAETSKRLLGIDIHPEKEEAYSCIIRASLRLMQKNLEITACRLFTIDNTLIFASISAGCTYLFVMMQYELEHSKIVQSYPSISSSITP